jgi:hypothetical protein
MIYKSGKIIMNDRKTEDRRPKLNPPLKSLPRFGGGEGDVLSFLLSSVFCLLSYFLISLRISFPFAKIRSANRITIPVICAYSRNLSLGFLPVTTSYNKNIT